MNLGNHDDGYRPSVDCIRGRLARGEYGPEVVQTVRTLLGRIDELEAAPVPA